MVLRLIVPLAPCVAAVASVLASVISAAYDAHLIAVGAPSVLRPGVTANDVTPLASRLQISEPFTAGRIESTTGCRSRVTIDRRTRKPDDALCGAV
jgi:hypothetical protein